MDESGQGRLTFRPRPSRGEVGGVDAPLGLAAGRDGVLYVPDTAERSAPLLLFLHGAGGTARRHMRMLLGAADRYGVVLAAPESRGQTWDLLTGGFGPDVAFVDRVLDAVVDLCDLDPTRYAVGGVSDGASYALSLGLANGDIFEAIVAFSPGFAAPGSLVGRPRLFISHGTADPVLPVEGCSRRIVRRLTDDGYDVTYHEFDGGHTVPPVIADHGFRWLTNVGKHLEEGMIDGAT